MMDRAIDREQIELLKNWWNEYGKAILIAIVVGLAMGYGWRFWQQHKMERAVAASNLYQELLIDLQSNPNAVKDSAQQLVSQYPSTPYASMASLILAKQQVADNQLADATQSLQWVVIHSNSAALQQVARIREARVLIAKQQPEQAIKILQTVNDATFAPLIDDAMGDAYKAMGQNAQAQNYYQQASIGLAQAQINNPFLSLKASQP